MAGDAFPARTRESSFSKCTSVFEFELLNSSKIKNELKWKCKSSFDQRINETIIWYINKFKDNYFKNKNFKYRIGLKI